MTSSLKYASLYAKRTATLATNAATAGGGPPKKPAVLVCAVIPGNILPVVDATTYYGKHVADGYQSHFTIGIASCSFISVGSFVDFGFFSQ